jgi:peroxiredoxin
MSIPRALLLSLVLFAGYASQAQGPGDPGRASDPPVAQKPSDICPLKVGSHIPDVDLATIDGTTTNLRDRAREQPTILVFYRGGWCPYCNTQLEQLRGVEAELIGLGYQLLAISADRPAKLRESMERHSPGFILLSDSSMAASRAFGLAFQMDQKAVQKYLEYDIDLEAASGQTHHQLPVPAVYVVGTDRLVYFAYAHPNHRIRLDPDLLVAAARSALE